MSLFLEQTAMCALVLWSGASLSIIISTILNCRQKRQHRKELRQQTTEDYPVSVTGCSQNPHVFVGMKDQRAIEISVTCSDKMTALTKYGVKEEEYEKLLMRAEIFRKAMRDQYMDKPNHAYFYYADGDFMENHYREVRAWALEDVETEGLEEVLAHQNKEKKVDHHG